MNIFATFVRDENGASLVEYSILIGLIAAATVALIDTVGDKVFNAWCALDVNWMRVPNEISCDGTVEIVPDI